MKKIVWLISALSVAAIFSASNILAEEPVSMREISKKQDRILEELAQIKSEINIIKIRVSSG